MRIDYSEPKKSYTSPQTGHNRPRKESSGSLITVVTITCLISLGAGFGGGWMLSQRSAKKGFKAAMEQQSLENQPRQTVAQAAPLAPQTPSAQAQQEAPQQQPGGTQPQPVTPVTQATPEPPLSFYKNLPSGQKNNVLGSGINIKDDKPAKQPLQAAIPANLSKQGQSQVTVENPRPSASTSPEKAAGRPEGAVFTVQIASFSLKSEAEALKSKLSGKGYNVYIAESNQGNKGTWYRVRVGKGLEHDAAKELAGKLGKGAMAIPEKD
jgi:cell division protein FtsN